MCPEPPGSDSKRDSTGFLGSPQPFPSMAGSDAGHTPVGLPPSLSSPGG